MTVQRKSLLEKISFSIVQFACPILLHNNLMNRNNRNKDKTLRVKKKKNEFDERREKK